MRIIYLTEYSCPNVDGVWARVYNESKYLIKKGHEVYAFSSNVLKPNKILPYKEVCEGINIFRFSVRRITENASFWPASLVFKKFLEIKPNVIICNNRHPEVKIALKYSARYNIPCLLVTHAPFLEKGIRSRFLEFLANLYDKTLDYNKFTRIMTITKWENPYLYRLGVKKEKIIYAPNIIPDEFFRHKKIVKKARKFIFLGRVVDVKNLETLLFALDKEEVELVGPVSKDYKKKLMKIIKDRKLNVKFIKPIYDLKQKIKKLMEADVFILPSKREGLPQSLLEAMALGIVPIASKNQGAKEVINEKNGFLFEIGDSAGLRNILDSLKGKNLGSYSREARKTAEGFKESLIMEKVERLYLNLIRKKSIQP